MGDSVSCAQAKGWRWRIAVLTFAGLWVASSQASPEPARPRNGVAGEISSSLEIRSVDVRDEAPGASVLVEASGPVAWTSFRDTQGHLVVELPNSRPNAAVESMARARGLIASIAVEEVSRINRPVTLLKIATREPVEHSLSVDGSHLAVRLLPIDTASSVNLSYEPLPNDPVGPAASAPSPIEEELLEPEPAVQVAQRDPLPRPVPVLAVDNQLSPPDVDPPAAGGTPDAPVAWSPNGGVEATRLDGIDVSTSQGDSVIRVLGDGEFRYSHFSLDDPERFVIDLEGVVKHSGRDVFLVESDVVERVRVSQFRPYPEPVSRVVFDLNRPAAPDIERSSDGLTVRFGSGAGFPASAADPTLASDPEPPPAADPEPAPPPFDDPGMPLPPVSEAGAEPSSELEAEEMALEDVPVVELPAMAVVAAADPTFDQVQDEPPPPMPEPEPEILVEEVPIPTVAAPPTTSDLEVFSGVEIEREPPAAPEAGTGNFAVQALGGQATEYVGEPITLSVRDADLVEVLRMFAQISDLNIVIQPGVRGTVTVELESVPWDQALMQILKLNGLGFELEGNIMRIAPTDILRQEAEERQRLEQARALSVPLTAVMKRLSYANANQVATLLRQEGGVLSQRGSVIVDQRTNTMIIRELPEFLDTVIAVIENLDTPEPQVMIEARIVETTKRFSRTLGIAWSFNGISSAELGNTTGLVFPNNIDASGGVNLITGGDNGFLNLSLGNVLNSFTLDVALQAAETEGLINILSAPKVATLNNQRASIQSGLQIPIQTVANNTVTVQFINATLELSVTPQVTAEGTILMDIDIAKREPQLAFAIQGASNAPISTKEASTRVIVRDGGTTVIGGIYEVSTDQGEDRVPGLSNIPIIGHLFRNKRRTDENEELLIFITPRVINL